MNFSKTSKKNRHEDEEIHERVGPRRTQHNGRKLAPGSPATPSPANVLSCRPRGGGSAWWIFRCPLRGLQARNSLRSRRC